MEQYYKFEVPCVSLNNHSLPLANKKIELVAAKRVPQHCIMIQNATLACYLEKGLATDIVPCCGTGICFLVKVCHDI